MILLKFMIKSDRKLTLHLVDFLSLLAKIFIYISDK